MIKVSANVPPAMVYCRTSNLAKGITYTNSVIPVCNQRII